MLQKLLITNCRLFDAPDDKQTTSILIENGIIQHYCYGGLTNHQEVSQNIAAESIRKFAMDSVHTNSRIVGCESSDHGGRCRFGASKPEL